MATSSFLPTIRTTKGALSAGLRASAWTSRRANSARSVIPAKNIYEHDLEPGISSKPAKHADKPGRIAAHLTGADVAEIRNAAAPCDEFVDQHHRKACAGCHQSDGALRIEVDEVEAFDNL